MGVSSCLYITLVIFSPFIHLLNCLYLNQWVFLLLLFPLSRPSCWRKGIVTGCLASGWGQPTTLYKANPPFQRVHQQQKMPGQGWDLPGTEAHTRTKQHKNRFLQGVKKVNKRYPKVWVGYHITLFNCFVTMVSWSSIFTWHLFSQASCKTKKSRDSSLVSWLAELCGKDSSYQWHQLGVCWAQKLSAFPVQEAGTKPLIKLGTFPGFFPSLQWHLATHYHTTMPKFLHMLNRQKVSSVED